MSANNYFTKESLDHCLMMLGKEFRKRNGKTIPAEIILIGGASVLLNYGFRDKTYDIDALIHASSSMKEAITCVGDRLGLPYGWLNSDFTKTKSYSPKVRKYSVYYKTFSNVLTVRTVSGEYLLAMKLMSGRQYKNDISDIVGILWEQKQSGKPLTMEQINLAVHNLYDGWEKMSPEAKILLENILASDNLEKLYQKYREEEQKTKEALVHFEKVYPNVTNKENVQDIIKHLKRKQNDQFHFRSIHTDEIDQAVAIEQICFPPHEACSEKSITRRIAKARDLFLVAVDKETGKLAGFLNGLSTNEETFRDEFFTDADLYEPDGTQVMLLGLDVLPEYRGRGLATELVNRYAQRERENQRKRLILTCLDDKVEMYKKMGFQDDGIANSTWGGEQWHQMSRKI